MRHFTSALVAASIAAFALFGASCDDDSSSSQPGACLDGSLCGSGGLCVGGYCGSPCASSGECESSEVCATAANSSRACVPAECGCLTCDACPAGNICVNGGCQEEVVDDCPGAPGCPGAPCTEDSHCDVATERCLDGSCVALDTPCTVASECGEAEVCDEGACRACEGDECVSLPDCTVDGCEAGFACDTETGECVAETTGGGTEGACEPCASSESCGAESPNCVPRGSGQFCLPSCTTSDDCETGWTCFDNACTPSAFDCLGCAVDGCAEGETCNTTTGVCVQPKAQCEQCSFDWECGDGWGCHKTGGVRRCVPRCGAGCPAGSSCTVDGDSQMEVCSPSTATCCFSANPEDCDGGGGGEDCTPACGGTTPFCNGGTCVECTGNQHCSDGAICNLTTGFCGGGGSEDCTSPTPYYEPSKDACVQCLNTTQCPSGETCSTQTNTCGDGSGGGDECTCEPPYPACAEYQGETYCVQCSLDEHCGVGGVCQTDTFTCDGGTVTPTEACESNADCDAGSTTFSLTCEVASGFCYDVTGACDDVTAHCKSGAKCTNFFDAFLGGGAGGGIPIPPELLGGDTLPGICECDFEACFGGDPSCPCPGSCNPLFALTGGSAACLSLGL